MKQIKTPLLTALATLVGCCISHASITNATWNADGDGAITCLPYTYANGILSMYGDQHSSPAHMVGTVDTTDPFDPTLTLSSAVDNDTGFAWIGYQVNVYMAVPFTFAAPGPSVNNPPTGDWFVASAIAPALVGGLYKGTLNFTGPTQVGIGDELEFLYSIAFEGSLHYSFTQEMIPIFVPVPEPSTLALMAMGGLALTVRHRRSIRASA